MGKVVVDLSMSLDGFIAGPNDAPDMGLGEGGERLHAWGGSAGTDVDSKLLESSIGALGAIISGRRNYDNSWRAWGVRQGPHDPTPVFVVSHGVHEEGLGEGSPFTFVDGIESALDLAQKAAGDKDVRVMGGADVAQQYLDAGLVDEVSIHLVPVLLGGGRRLFDNLGPDVELRQVEVIGSDAVTHLRYHVVR